MAEPLTETTPAPPTQVDINNPFSNKYSKQATGQAPMEKWQERQLSEIEGVGSEDVESYAKEAKLNQNQKNEMNFHTEQSKAMLRSAMKETSWEHAIVQLGYDSDHARRMLEDAKKHRAAVRARYTGFVTTVAKLVVMYYTFGASGAAATGAASAK